MNTKIVERNGKINTGKTNAIIVTISETEKLINQIIKANYKAEIINFSWIMSTTPENQRWKDNVTNMHYMFGPYRTNKLNAIHRLRDLNVQKGIIMGGLERLIQVNDKLVSQMIVLHEVLF